jgi:hypothetical protein
MSKSNNPENKSERKTTWRPFEELLKEKFQVIKGGKVEPVEETPKVESGEVKLEKKPRKEKAEEVKVPKTVEEKTVEEWYEELKEEYKEGRLSVEDIENYIKEYKEFERVRKPQEPIPEQFESNIVKAHYRLLGDIRMGKIEKLKPITEEEINRLLIAAGIPEKYLRETAAEGMEILKEIVKNEITEEKIKERAVQKQISEEEAKKELEIEEFKKFFAGRELITRGIWGWDKFRRKWGVKRYSNLDGRCAISLLKLAGIDISKIKYVAPGDFRRGAINLNTGMKEGFLIQTDIKEEGKPEFTIFFDHHGPKSKRDTSTTQVTYETLIELGLLKKTEEMDKLVEFVTQVDNFSYPGMEKYFETSDRTILGLASKKELTFENLLDYIKSGRSPTEILSDEDLKKYNLLNASEKQRKNIQLAKEKLNELEKEESQIIETNYGKIVVNILKGKKKENEPPINQVQWIAAAKGYDGILVYDCRPGEEGFFLALNRGELKDLNLPQGQLVRDVMFVQAQGSEPLRITLEDLIKAITPKSFEPKGKLKKFLEEEHAARKRKEMEIKKIAGEVIREAMARRRIKAWPEVIKLPEEISKYFVQKREREEKFLEQTNKIFRIIEKNYTKPEVIQKLIELLGKDPKYKDKSDYEKKKIAFQIIKEKTWGMKKEALEKLMYKELLSKK